MAKADPVTPNRAILSKLFPNHETMIAFERVFQMAGEITPEQIKALSLSIGIASNQALQALDSLQRIADALELLASGPVQTPYVQEDFLQISNTHPADEPIHPADSSSHPVDERIEPPLAPPRIIPHELAIQGDLVLPGGDATGIMVDQVNPTFAYRDLLGPAIPRSTGAGRPNLSVFRGGKVRLFAFGVNEDLDYTFHIPHDYVVGSDLELHIHWSHNGTAITGNFVIEINATYAKGFGQQIFPAEVLQTFTIATVNIATTPRYGHFVDAMPLSTSGGSASTLDTDDLEADGIITFHLDVTGIPTITGGAPNEPFIIQADIHMKSTGIGTKDKQPPFYI